MPTLRNIRRELFCQKLADGMFQVDAYEHAGYPRSSSNASNLAKQPEIRARVEEVLADRRAVKDAQNKITEPGGLPNIEAPGGKLTPEDVGLTEEWLVRQLMANIRAAQADAKYKEVNTAIEMLGNYFGGLFSPKNTADKSKSPGGSSEEDARKAGLDDLMKRMAEGLSQSEKAEDD